MSFESRVFLVGRFIKILLRNIIFYFRLRSKVNKKNLKYFYIIVNKFFI